MTLTDILIIVFVALLFVGIITLRILRGRKSKSPCSGCPYKAQCDTKTPRSEKTKDKNN